MRPSRLLTILLLAMLATTPALAQKPGKGKGKHAEAAESREHGFSDDQRRVMDDYFRTHRMEVQPLPPGIAKRVARGKPLPPGIAKRMVPAELEREIVFEKGYHPVIAGQLVVLVDAGGIVVDILADILH